MTICTNIQTISTISGLLIVVIRAAWGYYRSLCRKERNIYKLRAETAEYQLKSLNDQIPNTEPIINNWKESVKLLQSQLLDAETKLSSTSKERDELSDNLNQVIQTIEAIQNTNDPLINLIASDLYSTDGLR